MSWRRMSKAIGLAIDKVVTASKLGSHARGVYVVSPWIPASTRLCWSRGDCAGGSIPAPERMLSKVSYQQQRGSDGISNKPRQTFGLGTRSLESP
jgi:hypothetical protein